MVEAFNTAEPPGRRPLKPKLLEIQCVYCSEVKPPPKKKGEHIILDGLGGHATILDVCKECNQWLGERGGKRPRRLATAGAPSWRSAASNTFLRNQVLSSFTASFPTSLLRAQVVDVGLNRGELTPAVRIGRHENAAQIGHARRKPSLSHKFVQAHHCRSLPITRVIDANLRTGGSRQGRA